LVLTIAVIGILVYLETPGVTDITPSTTLVTVLLGLSIFKSKTYLPGAIFAVVDADIAIEIFPVAGEGIVTVKEV
jgi:hypothetical protein